MYKFLSILLVASLYACATQPPSKIKFNKLTEPDKEFALVYIYNSGDCKSSYNIYLNDELIIDLNYQAYTAIKIPPGLYTVESRENFLDFTPTKLSMNSVVVGSFQALSNKIYFIKQYSTIGYRGCHSYLKLHDPKISAIEIKKTYYLSPKKYKDK